MKLEHTVLFFIVLAVFLELVLIRNKSFAHLGNANLSVEHNAYHCKQH